MKNESIIYFGKCVFWLFFLLGSICFFGHLFSKNGVFAIVGFFLLIFGKIINLLIIIGLAIYGFADKTQFRYCLKSIAIICINIPMAILYAAIDLV